MTEAADVIAIDGTWQNLSDTFFFFLLQNAHYAMPVCVNSHLHSRHYPYAVAVIIMSRWARMAGDRALLTVLRACDNGHSQISC